MSGKTIPVTVFTGFLGSGKTTVILSLLPQLPAGYKVVLLKNEFGDVEVDSQLAKQSSLAAVSEILNGCMCCVLVGQMKTALLEIRDTHAPDRIIIETSGSAFPATLAFQIRELERETHGDFVLDAIITVIDCENFRGFDDQSPTARMQAQYTDVILLNKWERVSERQLDLVVDEVHTLNDLTPKLRCAGRNGVDPNLIFGLDTQLFVTSPDASLCPQLGDHHSEIETCVVWRGEPPRPHAHDHASAASRCSACEKYSAASVEAAPPLTREMLDAALATLPRECIYRVKGFVRLVSEATPPSLYILNWAFGRPDFTSMREGDIAALANVDVRLTVMGEPGEARRRAVMFASLISAIAS